MEAAIVFPIFFFTLLAFLYFFQFMLIQGNVHSALVKTGRYFSDHGFLFQKILNGDKKELSEEDKLNVSSSLEIDDYIGKVADAAMISVKMRSYLDLALIENSCVIGGSRGMIFQGTLFDDKGYIDIICIYNIKFPIPILKLKVIPVVQRIRIRSFSGHKPEPRFENADSSTDSEESEKNDVEVYITETGIVYHTSRNCTHLKLSVKNVNYSEVELLRNLSGGKYHSCEICISKVNNLTPAIVYITETGVRYHISLQCSGLKRSIKVVKLSDVEDRRKCTRCRESTQ